MALQSIKYSRGSLQILDQLRLPLETVYEDVHTLETGWSAIRLMKVRGAPAIANVAMLSLAVVLNGKDFASPAELVVFVKESVEYLCTSRPTAVNLFAASKNIVAVAENACSENQSSVAATKELILLAIEGMLEKDISDNKAIGGFGADEILGFLGEGSTASILTHCNTGSLATAGYGTALGVIRALHERGRLDHVYCTETRPYNQGARLTAFELVHEKMPATLIVDSMVSILLKTRKISAIVVGADRVALNGDTANKIGTYQLAISAKYHGVAFYVAAPFTSVDLSIPSGDHIVIEERLADELTKINGIQIAAPGIACWNPSFDVTPSELITGIITELGVIHKTQSSEGGLCFDIPTFLEDKKKVA